MGSGASRENDGTADAMSPRVQGLKGEELMLDSPALLDLGHGTIRYRLPDEKNDSNQQDTKKKTGYFYHPRLDDFSEDAEISPEERFKLYYVFKGPKKDGKNKKLYYVYATSINAKDEGLKQEEYRPQGKGYNWPESYRKANNLYYDLTFIEQAEEEFSDSDSLSEDTTSIRTTTPSTTPDNKEHIRLVVTNSETVESLKKRLGLRLLIPPVNVHILQKRTIELRNEDVIGDLRTPEQGTWRKFAVNLHLS